MATRNIVSGISASLDQARAGLRGIDRLWSTTFRRETGRRPLAPGTHLRALRQGEAATMNGQGQVEVFNPHHRFAGVVVGLAQAQETEVVLHTRGAVALRIEGLTPNVKRQAMVYALDGDRFTLDREGAAAIGELLEVEDLDKCYGLVGVRLAGDERPFDQGLQER